MTKESELDFLLRHKATAVSEHETLIREFDARINELQGQISTESEIVECNIVEIDHELRYVTQLGNLTCETPIEKAFSLPDFIGFKFERDFIANSPVMFEVGEDQKELTQYKRLKAGEAKVLHATHVLFRSKK